MPRLTDVPGNEFKDSCCDGGKTSCNDNSTQSCGCDKGAGWICHMHKERAKLAEREYWIALGTQDGEVVKVLTPPEQIAKDVTEDWRTADFHNDHKVQEFATGATRNADNHKHDYEGFLDPAVLFTYGGYMQSHRLQRDGTVRDSDNWQKGIPLAKYMKSLLRHTFDLWRLHRGYIVIDPDTNTPATRKHLCCAILFNVQGYLFELIKEDALTKGVA